MMNGDAAHSDPGNRFVTTLDGLRRLAAEQEAERHLLAWIEAETAGLPPGWRCTQVVNAFLPFVLLELAGPSREGSLIWLHLSGRRFHGLFEALTEIDRGKILDVFAAALRDAFVRFVAEPVPHLDERVAALFALHPLLRRGLFEACLHDALPTPPLRLAGSLDESFDRRDAVIAFLSQDLQETLLAATDGALRYPDIFDGGLARLAAQGSACLDDGPFAYRFRQAGTGPGAVCYLVAGYDDHFGYALYLPQVPVLLALDSNRIVAEIAQTRLVGWFVRSFTQSGDLAPGYYGGRTRRFSSLLKAPPHLHVGHCLWNELSGIDRFVRRARTLPDMEWLVCDGDGPIEPYGPIDALFPQLRGRVTRGPQGPQAAIRLAMRANRIVTRVTWSFVSESLGHRIMRHARSAAAPGIARQLTTGVPVILLGLRVENRTHAGLSGFLDALVRRLLGIRPDCRFVVDGHNRRGDAGLFRSYAEADGDDTVTAERRILQDLRDAYGAHRIVDAIGLSLVDALALIDRCDAFVCPWGAGLAKYRWAARKPGFVFTSLANLQGRGDLGIYHDPAVMTPAPGLHWVRPAHVTDLPEAPLLVPHPDLARAGNFTLQDEAVIDDIVACLQDLLSRQRPA